MRALIKTLLLLGVVVLATTGQLTEDNDEEDTAITQSNGCKATVYDRVNYGGHSLVITDQNANFQNSYFNNRVDSIKISGTCSFLFYEDENFNNEKPKTTETHLLQPGNYPSPETWGARGDKISSARALPPAGTNAIAVFTHRYYNGPMAVLYGSHPVLSGINFNNIISSEIVIGGEWMLYRGSNYGGVSVTRTTGKYPTEYNLPDTISSIKYIPPPPPPPRRRRRRWRWKK